MWQTLLLVWLKRFKASYEFQAFFLIQSRANTFAPRSDPDISVSSLQRPLWRAAFSTFFSENKHAHSTHWWHFHRKNLWPTTRHTDEHPQSHSIFFTLLREPLSDWRPIGPNEKRSWKHQVQRGSVGENRKPREWWVFMWSTHGKFSASESWFHTVDGWNPKQPPGM